MLFRSPNRLEAGTPPIAAVIGLGAAIDFLRSLSRPALERHEQQLMSQLTQGLASIPAVKLYGTATEKLIGGTPLPVKPANSRQGWSAPAFRNVNSQ